MTDPYGQPVEEGGSMLPGPMTSLYWGAQMAKHSAGLQSGGMVGYSTFFTGYRGGEEGMGFGRSASLGRAGLKLMGNTARMLAGTSLGQVGGIGGLGDWVNRFQHVEEFGLAGVLGSVNAGQHANLAAQAGQAAAAGIKGSPKLSIGERGARARAISKAQGVNWNEAHQILKKDLQAEAALTATRKANAAKSAIEAAGSANTRGKGFVGKWLYGGAGGMGHNADTGATAMKWAERAGRNGETTRFLVAEAGSAGATFLSGKAGRLIGSGIKGAGMLEIAIGAAKIIGGAAGEAYGHLAQATARMQRSHSGAMSPAYAGNAARNERQRAMGALQSSVLAPQQQLMGNEASMLGTG